MRNILHLCIVVLALGLLAACGQTSSVTSAPQAFAVMAKEFAFMPATLSVHTGQPVTISLQNNGAVEHDWSIQEIDISGEATSAGDASAGHMMGGMGDEPKLHVAAGIGGKGSLTFTPSKPGTYTFYCTVAGHKEAGMVGTLTVTAS
ncbi:MAG: cupredoxin domain-containing protein [Roseiflexaceae bacterium]